MVVFDLCICQITRPLCHKGSFACSHTPGARVLPQTRQGPDLLDAQGYQVSLQEQPKDLNLRSSTTRYGNSLEKIILFQYAYTKRSRGYLTVVAKCADWTAFISYIIKIVLVQSCDHTTAKKYRKHVPC